MAMNELLDVKIEPSNGRRKENAMKGKKLPEEWRKNIIKSLIGNKRRKGTYHTKETRMKMSESQKRIGNRPPSGLGKKQSPGTIKKRLESRKGWKHSPESKRKLSLALKGRIPWIKGKHHTEEAKEKNRLAHLGKISPNKGKHLSEEKKEKMRMVNKGQHRSPKTEFKKGFGSGEKNFNWKGGITPYTRQIRISEKYAEWRQNVFVKDNFICQKCGTNRGGILEAHHKYKSFKKLIEEVKQNLPLFNLYDGAMVYSPLWNISNGETLCGECHKLTKTYLKGGKT